MEFSGSMVFPDVYIFQTFIFGFDELIDHPKHAKSPLEVDRAIPQNEPPKSILSPSRGRDRRLELAKISPESRNSLFPRIKQAKFD